MADREEDGRKAAPSGAGPRTGGDPGAEGEIRCKLERLDGSEWTVTDLTLTPEGLFVSAYRYVRERGLDAETRREELDHEPLAATDRVRCLSRRGVVRWTLSSPAPDDVIR